MLLLSLSYHEWRWRPGESKQTSSISNCEVRVRMVFLAFRSGRGLDSFRVECETWNAAFMAGQGFISSSGDPSHLNEFLDKTARIYNTMLRIQIPLQKRPESCSYLRAQPRTGEAIRRILECADEIYDAGAKEHRTFIVHSLI